MGRLYSVLILDRLSPWILGNGNLWPDDFACLLPQFLSSSLPSPFPLAAEAAKRQRTVTFSPERLNASFCSVPIFLSRKKY
ncbi:hypothetical protein L6164_017817 [Bauhinia variegata]|uniref:Uncharacterized protein n=1 Tax=Bauhinia variegata TaxID=167791 RepID=A0ACB9NAF4_BAUVA|nr:hypothetical protein L6164_017817 [Bauhinia variegata]